MLTNTHFLNALVQGDSKIILRIYKDCFPAVRKFVLRNSGKVEDAEDVFQKALIQITVRYKKDQFEIRSSFQAYLYVVCKNLWRRELNKSKLRVTSDGVVELVNNEIDEATALVEQKRQELFIEKLQEISENCKKILTLFFAKIPYIKIAKDHGYSSETVVRQRVFKCKKQLISLIKKDKRFDSLKDL